MKHKTNHTLPKLEFLLEHGSLLVMSKKTQQFWLHTVPKELKVKETRFNLTFRHT